MASAVTSRRLFVLTVSTLASALGFSLLALHLGGSEAALRATLRLSGRFSFILFLLPFVASAMHRRFRSRATSWMMKYRSELGLAFGGAHLAHLGLITWLAQMPAVSFPLLVLWVGGFGFFVVALLVATSFPRIAREFEPRRWRAIHRFGVHYIAVIFAYDMFKGLLKAPVEYAPFAFALVLALALRVTSTRRLRVPRHR